MLTLGLTGGVASGKSEVARVLSEQGAIHIDADEVARRLTERPGKVLDRIRREFGDAVFSADGKLDRSSIAERVFADPDARRKLESILHPEIRADIAAEIERNRTSGHRGVVVVEAALLVESGRADAYDLLLVVEAPDVIKRSRQVNTRGSTAEDADGRIRAQARPAQKLMTSDIVIWNDGDLQTLRARGRDVWHYLRRRFERGGVMERQE